jgi:hypothetical protein
MVEFSICPPFPAGGLWPRAVLGPGRELQRRDPEAREGAVTPDAGANPPGGTRTPPWGCSVWRAYRIQVPAVSPRADPSPECAGRFAKRRWRGVLRSLRERLKAQPSTTPRPGAFHGTAYCGSDPTGRANSRVGSHFPIGSHPSSRLDRAHDRTDGTRRPAHDTILGHIRPPRVRCRHPEQPRRQQ